MANGSGPGRMTGPGIVLGGLLLVLIVASVGIFFVERWWFTPLASVHGAAIDRLIVIVLVVTGIAFVAVQAAMAWFVVRYGASGNDRATYWHDSPKGEAVLIGITAITLTVLVFMGQRVWADIYFSDPPEDAIVVEVTGQQFHWVFHYPGEDGVFGRTDPMLIRPGLNDIGLDRNDPAAADDVVTVGNMYLVRNRPARVRLRSTDVIHSFNLPHLRVKQDSVPGMTVENWFIPTEAGQFEIACAELCGLGHYRMRAMLTVVETQGELDAWLEEQRQFQ